MAHAALLRYVPIPPANIHRAKGEDEPRVAAREYESTIRSIPRVGPAGAGTRNPIDAVILGLGEDGHTASLFPGRTTLHDSARFVETDVAPDGSTSRITLTPRAINTAAEIAFLVTGSAKAAIARAVLEGPPRPHELPAQLIRPVAGHVTWFLDAAAASALRTRPLC
jgi:6-phosphogluconolactonase